DTITEQSILDALHQISRDRWGDVLTFIESLRGVNEPAQEAAKRPLTATDLLESGLVGLWADRHDIGDSREVARRSRDEAQTRARECPCWIPMSRSTASVGILRPLPGFRGSAAPCLDCQGWSCWNSFKAARTKRSNSESDSSADPIPCSGQPQLT